MKLGVIDDVEIINYFSNYNTMTFLGKLFKSGFISVERQYFLLASSGDLIHQLC